MRPKNNKKSHISSSASHNGATNRLEARPKAKPMGLMQIYLLTTVIVSVFMLMVQMRIVDNHVVELSSSYLSSSSISVLHEAMDLSAATPKRDKCEDITADEDLKPILRILCKGGYDISENSKEVDRSLLPKWSAITAMYGPPKILGLETCPIFRNKTYPENRHVAPAGMFNTGTNLLSELIRDNCNFTDLKPKHRMRYQVPWGKHIPFRYRGKHDTGLPKFNGMVHSDTLPVVAVRDPYTWMQSMCLQPYAAQYDHDKSKCPNIVPYESDIEAHPRFAKMKYIPVNVKYDKEIRIKYESMAHFWNEWYSDYIRFENDNKTMVSPLDFPFIVVRMEDLIFHADTVIPIMCECGGGKLKDGGVKRVTKIANGYNHAVDTSTGEKSGLIRSVIKYGNTTRRRKGYPQFQLQAARDVLDPRLMQVFGYSFEKP